MVIAEMKPSQQAIQQAEQLARTAAQTDNWLEPVFTGLSLQDYNEVPCRHRANWEETEHFNHFYGRPLRDLADQEAKRFDLDMMDSDYAETVWYAFHSPLLEAFWDEWENKVNFYQRWTVAQQS